MRYVFALFLICVVLLQPLAAAWGDAFQKDEIGQDERDQVFLLQEKGTSNLFIRYLSIPSQIQERNLCAGSFDSDRPHHGVRYECIEQQKLLQKDISRNLADYRGLWTLPTDQERTYNFDSSVIYVHVGPVIAGKVRIKGTYVKERLLVDGTDDISDLFYGECPVANADVYIFEAYGDVYKCSAPTRREHEEAEKSFITEIVLLGDYIYATPSQFGREEISKWRGVLTRVKKE